jgi:hypothetical protein
MTSWRVLRDRGPLAFPTDADALGVVEAPDRQAARRQAENRYGRDVVVVQARLWPVKASASPPSGEAAGDWGTLRPGESFALRFAPDARPSIRLATAEEERLWNARPGAVSGASTPARPGANVRRQQRPGRVFRRRGTE